jgi:hypothetical protein
MHHLLRNKRTAYLTAFVLFIHIAVSAQLRNSLNLPDVDEKRYHIGIVIMGGQSRFQVNQHPTFLERDSVLVTSPENNMSFGIGGMHTLRLSNRFEARVIFPQLIFANKSITYHLKYPKDNLDEKPITTRNVESLLLGIPVQLKFKSDRIQNFRFYIMGGGKIEADLSSKARAKNAEDMIKLKPFDYGVEAGIGFNFYMPYFILSPEIKISNGVGNAHSYDPNLKFSNVIDKMQSRMIIFSLIFEG